ncbi:MAG TPA: 4a-hydroxytetrahydrobiopterin dehydratase [Candidatus Limnocylindria bacterium]|nr:4a-hydroxytetrahydrobiopterin dehydratase [Candidatus Limnocylindria bacterium]
MPLTEQQIKDQVAALTGWVYINGQIQKTYSLESFEAAIKLVNQIAMVAQNLNHHPDINIRYSKVTFMLSTHDEDGVTQKDFDLAKAIEQAAVMNV